MHFDEPRTKRMTTPHAEVSSSLAWFQARHGRALVGRSVVALL